MPAISGGHHIALTVTDADRSAEWYSGLLGMSVLATGDDETVKVRVLADPGSGWILGLRQYHGREGDGFDEFRTGLDHFAFGVENRAALEEWERELSARGVAYTPITETSIGSVIVFRDPDNIQLEFWLPAI
jgi:catechol 2,3-dioxygenase-like lactoylglutathione lyase family enzyme